LAGQTGLEPLGICKRVGDRHLRLPPRKGEDMHPEDWFDFDLDREYCRVQRRKTPVSIEARIIHETGKAWLVSYKDETFWLPKPQCFCIVEPSGICTFEIPRWLWEKRG
jgi:hypothetical protein